MSIMEQFHPALLSFGINADRSRRKFKKLAEKNRGKALAYINGDKIGFPELFILMPEIEPLDLYGDLSTRNNAALSACAGKLELQNLADSLNQYSKENNETTRQALKWMFETGAKWNAPADYCNDYDAVLDAAAAHLIITYRDKAILPAVIELIFRRNRKGLLIHDLVWSYTKIFDQTSLKMIAAYLKSSIKADNQLAIKLLHLKQSQEDDRKNRRKLYRDYLLWLEENRPYLYLTGQSFQSTSEPRHIQVDLRAKYLGKEISPDTGEPLESLTSKESDLLEGFKNTTVYEKELLAHYSNKMLTTNHLLWERWLEKQLKEQIAIAKANLEVGR